MALRKLSPELQAKAIAELNEEPNRIEEDIKAIKEWLQKQRHIIPRLDDQFILTYLRGCKFSLEKAKNKLENLYIMRTLLPELFEKRDPFSPEVQAILKEGGFLPLTKAEGPDSPRIILFRMLDPSVHKQKDILKVNMMISDILLNEDDQIIVGGMIGFQDLSGMGMSFMTHMDLSVNKKAMMFYEGAYPQRPKVMHMFNIPSFFDTIWTTFKPFMKEKMLKRMMIHRTSGLEEMYKHLPKAILPEEYGGEGGPIQELIDHWKQKVESYAEWFKEDEKYKSDESKRIGKPKTESDLFGIEGSFRKLNVD